MSLPVDSLPAVLQQRATDEPERTYLQDVSGGSLTYAQVYQIALTWAAAFREQGVQAGDTVAVMLSNRLESMEVWLGIAWLRALEVPINTAYRGHMLQYVLNNSQSKGLVIASQYLDLLSEIASDLPHLQFIVVLDTNTSLPELPVPVSKQEQFLSSIQPATDLEAPRRHDIATIVYTSGTTGPSKGVLIPWGQLMTTAINRASMEGVPPRDTFYSFFPFFHVSGKAFACIQAIPGGRLVFREKLSIGDFWNDIRRFGCTSSGLIAVAAQWLLNQEPRPDDAENPLQNLVLIPIIPNFEEFKRRFGIQRISTNFGMTEAGGILNSEWNPRNIQSCGRAEPGYEIRVVDDHDYPVAPGEVGELIVRSAEPWSLMIGYFGMPEKTAEAWRNGWFHTGDTFTYDEEGNFYFVDRKKDTMRRRGENISSFEVEAVVNRHPAIQESAAIAVPGSQGEDEVKIIVVLKPDQMLTYEVLADYLIANMPTFMVPRYIEFVESLPKTPIGKVRKVELRAVPLTEKTWDRLASVPQTRR